ncbi:MAG: hypothetical protein JRJ54_04480 [Deltaproteobacteria bacterium]|nr:hypothetical protein [Deltaproteobacteria bacterium]
MKTAFAQWDNRIAPVFDTARLIHIIETAAGEVIAEMQETLPKHPLLQKALRLLELGVDTLVCGAISRQMHGLISAYDIQIIPFVTGDLNTIIRAWRGGTLSSAVFCMPGYRGWGRQRFRGRQRGRWVNPPFRAKKTKE